MKIMLAQRIVGYSFVGLVAAPLAAAIVGCEYFPESTFTLASDSRLPKWFVLSPGMSRADVSVSMSYYIKPSGRTATLLLQNSAGKTIKKANGKLACDKPFYLKIAPKGSVFDYPAYEIITVDDITEIIEHKSVGSVFYVTDNPVIWMQYVATGCG